MAEVHHLAGSGTPALKARPPIPVEGWACETAESPEQCAVVVNPAAPNSALADWARAQVEQSGYVLRALAMTGQDEGVGGMRDVFGALQHFQQQAESVLRELSNRLQHQETQANTDPVV